MKKLIVASLVSSALVGCGSGGSSDPETGEQLHSRSIDVQLGEVQAKNPEMDVLGRMHGRQTDSSSYEHRLMAANYELCVVDQIGTEQCVSISDITQPFADSFTVKGSATLTVAYAGVAMGELNQAYTIGGSAELAKDEDAVTVQLSNTDWAYVTIDHEPEINTTKDPKINGVSMRYNSVPMPYWNLYVNKSVQSANLLVTFYSGSTLEAQLPAPMQANHHYAYEVSNADNHDTGVDFEIVDKWEEPEPICIGNACLIAQ